jgi:hypothetical protein
MDTREPALDVGEVSEAARTIRLGLLCGFPGLFLPDGRTIDRIAIRSDVLISLPLFQGVRRTLVKRLFSSGMIVLLSCEGPSMRDDAQIVSAFRGLRP